MLPDASTPQAMQRRRLPPIRPPAAPQAVDDTSSPEDDARLLLGAHAESDSISDEDNTGREDDVGGSLEDYPARVCGAANRDNASSARERRRAESPVLAHQPQKELDYEDLAKYFHLPITEGKLSFFLPSRTRPLARWNAYLQEIHCAKISSQTSCDFRHF